MATIIFKNFNEYPGWEWAIVLPLALVWAILRYRSGRKNGGDDR